MDQVVFCRVSEAVVGIDSEMSDGIKNVLPSYPVWYGHVGFLGGYAVVWPLGREFGECGVDCPKGCSTTWAMRIP